MKQIRIRHSFVTTPIGYYISSELFKEIFESVYYFHKQNIIHRDLKPSNILLTNVLNGRFVKIADSGLATIHEFDDQSYSEGKGTLKKWHQKSYTVKNVIRMQIFSV
jgi:serine/threonine protein kinase